MYINTARVHLNSDDPILRVSVLGYMTSEDIQRDTYLSNNKGDGQVRGNIRHGPVAFGL
jgi:hypothetical protein